MEINPLDAKNRETLEEYRLRSKVNLRIFKREITDYSNIPAKIKVLKAFAGISKFLPIQNKALSAGILDGKNLVICSPTGSGKTLPVNLAAVKMVTDNKKRVVFLEPLRAITYQKVEELESETLGIKSTAFTGEQWANPNRADVIYATPERFNISLLANDAWLYSIGLVVIDECDTLNELSRGAILEESITLLHLLRPEIQIVMLSATLSNGQDIATWIDGVFIEDSNRPVALKFSIYSELPYHGTIPNIIVTDSDFPESMLSTLKRTIIFASTRSESRDLAMKYSKYKEERYTSTYDIDKYYGKIQQSISRAAKYGNDKLTRYLINTIHGRVAFHNAGLSKGQRKIIEDNFNNGSIEVLVCTATLSRGVNLQADTVLLYDGVNTSYRKLSITEFKQICGRAGRLLPNKSSEGNILIRAKDENPETLIKDYILGPPEQIKSKLDPKQFLVRISNLNLDLDVALSALNSTFYAKTCRLFALTDIKNFIKELSELIFLDDRNKLMLKDLGTICLERGISPDEVSLFKNFLDDGVNEEQLIKFIVNHIITTDESLSKRLSEEQLTVLITKYLQSEISNYKPKALEHSNLDIGSSDFEKIIKTSKKVIYAMIKIAKTNKIEFPLWLYGSSDAISYGISPKKYGEICAVTNSRSQVIKFFNKDFKTVKKISKLSNAQIKDTLELTSDMQPIIIKTNALQILEGDSFFSVHDILDYIHCPLSFLLKYHKNFLLPSPEQSDRLVFGTRIHKIINKFLIETKNVNDITTQNYIMKRLLKKVKDDRIIEQCFNFIKYLGTNKSMEIDGSEVPFTNESLKLNGKIDIIAVEKGLYKIIDIKSGEYTDDRFKKDSIQVLLYGLLLSKLYKGKLAPPTVLYLADLVESSVPISDTSLKELEDMIGSAHELIKDNNQSITKEKLVELCSCRNYEHRCVCNYITM